MAIKVTSQLRHEPPSTKGSRFIVTIAPVSSEKAAQSLLAHTAAEMPDASHHCWAWRIATPAIDRAGDAGEPGGSAGRPILAQLTGRDLVDTAVIVSRYFGGTKLGVGGLVRAYGGAAGSALDIVAVAPWALMVAALVVHEHADGEAVSKALATHRTVEVEIVYGVRVTRHIEVASDDVESLNTTLADATAGRVALD